MELNFSEIRGKLVKKGGKYLTLAGKISFVVTSDQIQKHLDFSKSKQIGGILLKGGKITSLKLTLLEYRPIFLRPCSSLQRKTGHPSEPAIFFGPRAGQFREVSMYLYFLQWELCYPFYHPEYILPYPTTWQRR
jgi:hypothetical protein